MFMKKRLVAGVVLFFFLALSGLYYYTRQEQESVKFGAVLHLTGDQAEPARAFREGIELATLEINQRGGIRGLPLKVIIEDDKLQTKEAFTAAKKLIEIDHVDAAIDASYLEVMANGVLFQNAKIPVITLWDSSKEIEALGNYIFGIGIWTPSAGEKSAKFAISKLSAQTAVIINIQNEWSQAVSVFFKKKYEELGGKVLDTYTLVPGTNDFRTTLAKVKAQKPDVIYSPITDGVVQFYKQAEQLKLNTPTITSDIITAEHTAAAPSAFEGIYQTQAQDPDSPETEHMKRLYKETYGMEPTQPLFVAWGYDAVQLFSSAMEKLGSSGEKVRDYLRENVKEYKGASGSITITNGSSPKLEKVFRIEKAVFIPVE